MAKLLKLAVNYSWYHMALCSACLLPVYRPGLYSLDFSGRL